MVEDFELDHGGSRDSGPVLDTEIEVSDSLGESERIGSLEPAEFLTTRDFLVTMVTAAIFIVGGSVAVVLGIAALLKLRTP